MNRNYYIYDEDLSEEEAELQKGWNEYVRMVEENNRKTKRADTIFAILFILIIALILFFVFCGKLLTVAFM